MRWQSTKLTVITYNVAISACDKGPKPERAFELFEAMRHEGIKPDVTTYFALISACEEGQEPEVAP